VGRLAPLSERARGQGRLPASRRQCASERAHDLRRATARKEEESREDASARRGCVASAPRMLPPGRIAHHL
jgi:hypothetical protein